MAERLTEHNKTGWVLKLNDLQNEFEARQQLMSKFKLACEKLGRLEDILEKYGIESVEEFDKNIEYVNKIIKAYKTGSWKKEKQELKTDRNTWKRACEFLAYKYAKEYFDGRDVEHCFNADKRDKFIKENIDYFYQQAKKEGEGK